MNVGHPTLTEHQCQMLRERVGRFIAAGMADLAGLRHFAQELSGKDRADWKQALIELYPIVLTSQPLPLECRAGVVCEELNRRWLARRGLFLFAATDNDEADQPTEKSPSQIIVGLHRVVHWAMFPRHADVRGFAQYVVDGSPTGDRLPRIAYTAQQQAAIIDRAVIREFTNSLWGFYAIDRGEVPQPDASCWAHVPKAELYEQKLLALALLPEYSTPNQFYHDYAVRVEVECTRRALDFHRVMPPMRPVANGLDDCLTYLRRLLRSDGVLARVLLRLFDRLTPDASEQELADLHITQQAVSVLSGQLTACAVSPNPHIIVREWEARLARLDRFGLARDAGQAHWAHTLAAIAGVELLTNAIHKKGGEAPPSVATFASLAGLSELQH
ncbi:MAG: hypothetical protein L0Z53_20610, partial [Acidobacteriales bacterium]|nr:hypothetical protein [Terriglobales bacterium]